MNRLLIALLLTVLGARAATQLAVGSASAAAGGSTALTLSLQSDVPVTAFQVDLVTTPALVEFQSQQIGGGLDTHAADGQAVSAGVYRIIIYSVFNQPLRNGPILTLSGAVSPLAPSGIINLSLSNVIVSSPVGLAVSNVQLLPGTLQITIPSAVRINSVSMESPGGSFLLRMSGLTGTTLIVEGSSDLRNWNTVITQSVTPPTATVILAIPTGQSYQFYRVRLP